MSVYNPYSKYNPFNNPQYDFDESDLSDSDGDLMLAPFSANSGVKWKELPEGHVVEVQIPPRMKKEEVKIEILEDNFICVSGETSLEKETKGDRFYSVERASGSFEKLYRLPENLRVGDMKANMGNGVVVITVPREKKMLPHYKPIPIFWA